MAEMGNDGICLWLLFVSLGGSRKSKMRNFTKKAQLKGLVFTRKEGDQILVNGGEIRIEIVEISGRWVRLAFEASKEISIRRAEAKKE